MSVETDIGARVRDLRSAQGLTQAGLGELLGKYLPKHWSRQAVSTAEQGGRAFIAAEVIALATVLQCSVSYLMEGGDEIRVAALSVDLNRVRRQMALVEVRRLRNTLSIRESDLLNQLGDDDAPTDLPCPELSPGCDRELSRASC